MKKINMCQCSTSKDCINYVRTGQIGDVSCRHYVNPNGLPGVVKSDYECINYVTEEGLEQYKAILEDVNDCDYDEEEMFMDLAYDKGYQTGYEQGWNDAVTEEATDYYNEDEDDYEDDCEDDDYIELDDNYVSGILREDKGKPNYIVVNKSNPMQVFALQATLFENAKVWYSSDAEKLRKFVIKYKPDFVNDMLVVDFDTYKKSFETKEEPMEEYFLCNIKFVK